MAVYQTLDQMLDAAKGSAALPVIAVAAAEDDAVLAACVQARADSIATPLLVGNREKIEAMLKELGQDPGDYPIVDATDAADSAQKAVACVTDGRAHCLMKGKLGTADLLRAVLKPEAGLRTGRLLSHVMLYQTAAYPKLLAVTDGGMNPAPDCAQKADILENAAVLLQALGYSEIFAACVCGAEVENPKIQATVDAAALAGMGERWAPYGMTVYGPVGLDLAISPEACHHKGYTAPGGGAADILLVPTYEVGNAMGKSMTYFAAAQSAGVIVGARVPIVLVSRSDTAETKLRSIALAALSCGAQDK